MNKMKHVKCVPSQNHAVVPVLVENSTENKMIK